MASTSKAPKLEPKTEPMDTNGAEIEVISSVSELETTVMDLIAACPSGVTDPELRNKIGPLATAEMRQEAINNLIGKGRISLGTLGKIVIYRLENPDSLQKMRGLSPEEASIYQMVEKAGKKGIWINDMNDSGLSKTQIAKFTKTLEKKKIIKFVRSVTHKRRKMFILYDLEPDESHTGGAFYSNQEFDQEFADLLNQQCNKFLRQRAQIAAEKFPSDLVTQRKASVVTSGQVQTFIKELEISKIELKVDDIERVLNTLVYDGVAEKLPNPLDSTISYRSTFIPTSSSSTTSNNNNIGMVNSPCTFCPLIDDCRPTGLISPANCQYFKDWLIDG